MTCLTGASGKGRLRKRQEEAHPCRKVRLSYDEVQLQHCRWGGALTWAAPGLFLDPDALGSLNSQPDPASDGSEEGRGCPGHL